MFRKEWQIMKLKLRASALCLALVGMSGLAFAAGNNNSPPAGAILDLGGGETGTAAQAVNHGAAIQESVTFTAGVALTDITLAFREDPAFISLSNVSLINNTTSSSNLLLNGDFSGGTYLTGSTVTPNNWNFVNIYGAAASGHFATGCGYLGSNCWYDGAVQAYDAIDQVVATTIGDSYTLSFWYTDNSNLTTMSDLSTNGNTTGTGGNGIDILAYAQAGLPPACPPGVVCTNNVPEPGSLALVGLAMAGLAGLRRRKM
jgi:hypothetical protein